MRRVRCEVSYPGVAWLFARTRRDEGQDIPADLRFCGVWRDDPVTGSVILIFESSTFADQPELTPPDRFPEWTPSFKRARPVRQLTPSEAPPDPMPTAPEQPAEAPAKPDHGDVAFSADPVAWRAGFKVGARGEFPPNDGTYDPNWMQGWHEGNAIWRERPREGGDGGSGAIPAPVPVTTEERRRILRPIYDIGTTGMTPHALLQDGYHDGITGKPAGRTDPAYLDGYRRGQAGERGIADGDR